MSLGWFDNDNLRWITDF